jgi:hypothetical protein
VVELEKHPWLGSAVSFCDWIEAHKRESILSMILLWKKTKTKVVILFEPSQKLDLEISKIMVVQFM